MELYIGVDGSIFFSNSDPNAFPAIIKKLCFIRLRDAVGRERLRVDLYDGDKEQDPYASPYVNNLSMEQDIYNLRSYGVFISRKDALRIAVEVERHYYKMPYEVDEQARTIETDLFDILRYICDYLIKNKIAVEIVNGNELYNIKVEDFRNLIKDTPYSHYRQSDIRRVLRDKEYAACSTGRLENTTANGGKVVSLYADKPEVVEIMGEFTHMDKAERLTNE